MPWLSVRRSRSPGGNLLSTFAGFGLGFTAGFLLSGLVGDVGRERLRLAAHRLAGGPAPGPMPGREVASRIAGAFDADRELGRLGLEVRPVRGGRVELHGWVPARITAARAVRTASAAAPATVVTSRLRVRGEDEVPA